jgi:hypothetical protein
MHQEEMTYLSLGGNCTTKYCNNYKYLGMKVKVD